MAGAVIQIHLRKPNSREVVAKPPLTISAKAGGLRAWVSAADPQNALISRTSTEPAIRLALPDPRRYD